MTEYYLVEKNRFHPDSPHIEWRALLAIEGSKVSFHRGRLTERFEIKDDEKIHCVTSIPSRIYGPLTDEELENLEKMPSGYWGQSAKPKRIHSMRMRSRRLA